MDTKHIVEVLKYAKEHALKDESMFTTGRHFLSPRGNPLRAQASRVKNVAKNCVGGAGLRGIVVLGINKRASIDSTEYAAVMCALANTLKMRGSVDEKIRAVRRYNNEKGYRAIVLLVDSTIARLEKYLERKSRR